MNSLASPQKKQKDNNDVIKGIGGLVAADTGYNAYRYLHQRHNDAATEKGFAESRLDINKRFLDSQKKELEPILNRKKEYEKELEQAKAELKKETHPKWKKIREMNIHSLQQNVNNANEAINDIQGQINELLGERNQLLKKDEELGKKVRLYKGGKYLSAALGLAGAGYGLYHLVKAYKNSKKNNMGNLASSQENQKKNDTIKGIGALGAAGAGYGVHRYLNSKALDIYNNRGDVESKIKTLNHSIEWNQDDIKRLTRGIEDNKKQYKWFENRLKEETDPKRKQDIRGSMDKFKSYIEEDTQRINKLNDEIEKIKAQKEPLLEKIPKLKRLEALYGIGSHLTRALSLAGAGYGLYHLIKAYKNRKK